MKKSLRQTAVSAILFLLVKSPAPRGRRFAPRGIRQISMLAWLFSSLLVGINNLSGLAVNAKELPKAAIMAEAADTMLPDGTPDTPLPDGTPDTPPPDRTPDAMLPDGTSNAMVSGEAPSFHACVEYSSQGYVAKGSFTDIPSDISSIRPLYSLDGETYQSCGVPWDLHWMDITNEEDMKGAQTRLHNQICLYSNQEPLKSYLDKKLDRFFLKLRLSLKDGTTYESQSSLIDRGSPQPIPEGLCPSATFAPSLAAYDRMPFCGYGKYQITVSADATAEEIASCLPDTLPVEIKLSKGLEHITQGVVDCPVAWKPLSLPMLTNGETVTIYDAAEEIVVPEGSLIDTPTGIYRLDEPLKLCDQYGLTDEVRLILNIISKDKEPTGVLMQENAGLEMAFHQKPTGATDIQAYVLSENGSTWTNLPGLSLLDAVNSQPSTPNSGYALILDCNQEPYRSYLEETAAGNTPAPFFIGLTIKGGVYDGRQLILAWPDTYEIPPVLPKLGGSGGNEANAGADNQHDSTPEGQRPNLPQEPENGSDTKEPSISPSNSDNARPAPSETDWPSKTNVSSDMFSHSKTDIRTETNLEHDGKPGRENQQQEQGRMMHNPILAIRNVVTVLPYGDTSDAKKPPKDTTMTDTKKDTPNVTNRINTLSTMEAAGERLAQTASSALPSSGQDRHTDAKNLSGILGITDFSTADTKHGTFPTLAVLAAAGIIIIAAAARRVMEIKKS